MNLHPDIQQGLLEGEQAFKEGIFAPEHDKVWSENDIITFVSEQLSASQYRYQRRYEELTGQIPLSYLHHIGFVLGYINQALYRVESIA